MGGLALLIQLVSGILISIHYSNSMDSSFDSLSHILRDVRGGWFLRALHANTASFFFHCFICSCWSGALLWFLYIFWCLVLWYFIIVVSYGRFFFGLCSALGSNILLRRHRYY